MDIDTIVVGAYQVNCYVVSNPDTKEGLLIDPGFDCDRIKALLDKKGITARAIINTHGHADHICCNHAFDVPIYIHEAEAAYLTDPQKNLSIIHGLEYVSPEASLLLHDEQLLECAGFSIRVMHTPGHTPGCICLEIGDVVFTGDTLFRESIGRTDLPGGNSRQILTSICKKLLLLDDETCIYPGHGPSSTIGWEKKHNFFLRERG